MLCYQLLMALLSLCFLINEKQSSEYTYNKWSLKKIWKESEANNKRIIYFLIFLSYLILNTTTFILMF